MSVGTLNSSILRRRSGLAVLMELDKAGSQLFASCKMRVMFRLILCARHSRQTG
ncbi:MAG: hypothetical protein ACD_23C00376G0003 [uncultured bacterium]|nr:MAG: hypothetical protein ACD_23C00376G0003 [uncultured bacterium]